MFGRWDVEGVVRRIYDAAPADLAEPPGPIELARRLFGPKGWGLARKSELPAGAKATLRPVGPPNLSLDGTCRSFAVRVRTKLHERDVCFYSAHELGEWGLNEFTHYREQDREAYCDALAGGLIAPPAALRAMLRLLDWDGRLSAQVFEEVARIFVAPAAVMALRMAEVFELPLALVTPEGVLRRGDDGAWGDDAELRQLARIDEAALPLGLRRGRLPDAWRHVVLMGR